MGELVSVLPNQLFFSFRSLGRYLLSLLLSWLGLATILIGVLIFTLLWRMPQDYANILWPVIGLLTLLAGLVGGYSTTLGLAKRHQYLTGPDWFWRQVLTNAAWPKIIGIVCFFPLLVNLGATTNGWGYLLQLIEAVMLAIALYFSSWGISIAIRSQGVWPAHRFAAMMAIIILAIIVVITPSNLLSNSKLPTEVALVSILGVISYLVALGLIGELIFRRFSGQELVHQNHWRFLSGSLINKSFSTTEAIFALSVTRYLRQPYIFGQLLAIALVNWQTDTIIKQVKDSIAIERVQLVAGSGMVLALIWGFFLGQFARILQRSFLHLPIKSRAVFLGSLLAGLTAYILVIFTVGYSYASAWPTFNHILLKWGVVLATTFILLFFIGWWTQQKRSAGLAISLALTLATYLYFFSRLAL